MSGNGYVDLVSPDGDEIDKTRTMTQAIAEALSPLMGPNKLMAIEVFAVVDLGDHRVCTARAFNGLHPSVIQTIKAAADSRRQGMLAEDFQVARSKPS